MPRYRYAFQGKQKIDIFDLKGNEGDFTCIGCREKLQAKAMGKVRVPHFAHMPGSVAGGTCEETYYHVVGKMLFREAFRKCVREETDFFIHFRLVQNCPFAGKQPCYDPCYSVFVSSVKLTDYFDDVVLERKDGPFIPDLMLTSSWSEFRCYIEIFVSHRVSSAKKSSQIPIVEIKIGSEAALDTLVSCTVPSEICQVYSFAPFIELPEYHCNREQYAADRAEEKRKREQDARDMEAYEASQRNALRHAKAVCEGKSETRYFNDLPVTITFTGSVWTLFLNWSYHSQHATRSKAEAHVPQALAEMYPALDVPAPPPSKI